MTITPISDAQIISCYQRHGNLQLVCQVLHVSYKRAKSVLDINKIARVSGWKRKPFTIRNERRFTYGQDAEDEGGCEREGGSEQIQSLSGEEI